MAGPVHNCRVTTQIYYQNPDIHEFSARVESVTTEDGRTVVVLDQTAFYPEGGGQPADAGLLNNRSVVHVRKDAEAIAHILAAAPSESSEISIGDTVTGVVDAAHRRDYRQQHTGQHMISAALLEIGGFNTVSVHLGEEYATIEVDAQVVSQAQLDDVEALANSWIERAIPVTCTVVSEADIANYPLRRPPKVSGSIRLVVMDGVDCAACGGVHVQNSREVRLVRAIGTEVIRGHLRSSWKIGDRAIADYRRSSTLVSKLGEYLSAKPGQLEDRVAQQEHRLKETEALLKRSQERVHDLVARSLINNHPEERRPITAVFENEGKEFLRGVSKVLSEQPGVAACLVNRIGEQLQWSIVIAPEVGLDFGDVRDKLLPLIDAKGGGKPPIWQGMGTRSSAADEFVAAFQAIYSSSAASSAS